MTYILCEISKTIQGKLYQEMILNAENSKAFFDALSAPVRFNQKLTTAFEEHDKRVIIK